MTLRGGLRKALLDTGIIDDEDGMISYWTDTADGSFCGSPDRALDALEEAVQAWATGVVAEAAWTEQHIRHHMMALDGAQSSENWLG